MGVKKIDSTKQITEVFIYKLHGFPTVIVSDRDAKFKGNFWKDFSKHIGVSLNMSSKYHPQTNGETEMANKCMETYLCCFVIGK